MKKTKITSILPYLKYSYPIGIGTTSICFLMKNKKVLKLFLNTYNKEYLFSKYDNIINHFENINVLKNDSYIVPEELLIKDNDCIGYIYDYIDAYTFKRIKYNTKLDYLSDKYDKLCEDTKNISDRKFSLFDVHDKNILLGYYFYIIDLDQGSFKEDDIDNIFKYNMLEINKTIVYSLFNQPEYKLIEFKKSSLNEIYKEAVYKDYKVLKDFFEKLKKDDKIETKFDIRIKKNSLIRTEYNEYYRHY